MATARLLGRCWESRTSGTTASHPRTRRQSSEWINTNLEVSWFAFDEGVHNAEVVLIQKHTPLLNLRDNPGALPQLSALRTLCCQIAVTPAI